MTTKTADAVGRQTVRRLFEECFNGGKPELLSELVAADYQGGPGENGPEGMERSLTNLRRGFPDLRYTIEVLVADGDRVAVRWTLTGHHTGSFGGYEPSLKAVKTEGMAVFQVREGKIVRSWRQTDRLGFLQQIGAVDPTIGTGPASKKPQLAVKHVSVSINRPSGEVYDFASKPENMPQWASGLGGSMRNVDGDWVAEGPLGRVKVRFTERNALGILDHDVILDSGTKVHNPLRVIPRGDASEVVFTLFRQPGATDETFARDAEWVEKDLTTLKRLLEK